MFHAWVLLGRDHGDLGLGSVKEYRRPEVFLTTSLFLEQGLVAPFCGAGVFVDRDSPRFQDHRMSRVNQRVQAKMSTKDERTRKGARTQTQMPVRLYEEERCMGKPETLPRHKTTERARKGARTQSQMLVRL